MEQLAPLPPTAQAIADVVGRDHALALASSCKGRKLYIPKQMPSGHWIRLAVGDSAAQDLSTEYPGFILDLASCASVMKAERNAKIYKRYLAGDSTRDIARTFRLKPRQTREIIANMKKGTS